MSDKLNEEESKKLKEESKKPKEESKKPKEVKPPIINETEPPLTIASLLNLCWGLSLNFSHEVPQKTLGDEFQKKVFAILESYQVVKQEDGASYHPNTKTKKFFDNVIMSLSKCMRNIGFARHAHNVFLDMKKDEHTNRRNYYAELASISSLKKEGLVHKVLGFVGGGSILSVFGEVKKTLFQIDDTAMESIKTVISKHTNSTFADTIAKDISKSTEISFSTLASDVMVFIVFGIIGLIAVNIAAKIYVNTKLKSSLEKTQDEQRKYWVDNYRPEMVKCLYNVYEDVFDLIKKFYDPKYEEEFNIENIVKEPGDNETNKVKLFIKYKILPSYDIAPIHSSSSDIAPVKPAPPKPAKKKKS